MNNHPCLLEPNNDNPQPRKVLIILGLMSLCLKKKNQQTQNIKKNPKPPPHKGIPFRTKRVTGCWPRCCFGARGGKIKPTSGCICQLRSLVGGGVGCIPGMRAGLPQQPRLGMCSGFWRHRQRFAVGDAFCAGWRASTQHPRVCRVPLRHSTVPVVLRCHLPLVCSSW